MMGEANNSNSPKMSSREIAKITKKNHRIIEEEINYIEAEWEKEGGSKFELSNYADSRGNKLTEYLLNKEELLYISAKLNEASGNRLNSRVYKFETYLDIIRAYANEV